jgi:hypothetical protein
MVIKIQNGIKIEVIIIIIEKNGLFIIINNFEHKWF